MIRLLLCLLFATPALAQDRITGTGGVATLSAAADGALLSFLKTEAATLLEDAAAEGVVIRMTDQDRHVGPRYISLTRTLTGYGPKQVEALTWDRRKDAFVGLEAFLIGRGGTPGYQQISTTLRGALKRALGADWPSWAARIEMATVPDPTVLQNFTLQAATGGRPGALVFHFSAGEVAPDAISIAAPMPAYARYLTDAGRAALGPR